ncbi:MAG: hypothetical protein HY096_12585 [Nitrospinae bacterium]|nr:hypothetical protein [Nitrospinota bacterium]
MRKFLVHFIAIVILISSVESAEKTKITGEYSYTYGDNESIIEAKNICYSMAVRNAIESYKTFVVATSTVQDYKLIKDLIQTISSGYIEDLKTVEQTMNGRTVYTKVEGYIVPAVIDNVLKREVERYKGKEPEGVDDNGYVKILKVERDRNGVKVVFKVLKSGSFMVGRNYKIMIDYYDNNGDPVGGDGKQFYGGSSLIYALNPGEMRTVSFYIPENAISYRVWLLKLKI